MFEDLGVWELVSLSQLSEQGVGGSANQGDTGWAEQKVGCRSEDLWDHSQWRWTLDKELKMALECQA